MSRKRGCVCKNDVIIVQAICLNEMNTRPVITWNEVLTYLLLFLCIQFIAVVRHICSFYPLSSLENGCMGRLMDEEDHCEFTQSCGHYPSFLLLGMLLSSFFPF